MKLIVLGSGTAVPDPERGSPGLALEVGKRWMLLDIGSGSLHRAERAGVPVNAMSHVLLTHLHPDHTGDLVPLLFAFRNAEMGRRKRVTIVGPRGMSDFVRSLEGVYGEWIAPLGYPRVIKEIGQGPLVCGGVRITASPVVHGPPSVAYRIEDSAGKGIVYSGDTDYCTSLINLAADADLLILESSFPEGRAAPGHLTPSVAGRIAHECRCKRLLLTHFYPACKGHDIRGHCARSYSGEILLARDLMEVAI